MTNGEQPRKLKHQRNASGHCHVSVAGMGGLPCFQSGQEQPQRRLFIEHLLGARLCAWCSTSPPI